MGDDVGYDSGDLIPHLLMGRESTHAVLECIDTTLAILKTIPFDMDDRRIEGLKRLRRAITRVCARNQW